MVEDFNRYLKRATTLGFTIGVLLVSLLFVAISFIVWQESRDRQIDPWLEIFPQNVLSHLVESDYHPISSKIRLIQKTNLFDKFAVYDSGLEYIDGFGISSNSPLKTSEALPIKDESGGVWGWYVYHKNEADQFYYLKLISGATLLLLLMAILLIQFIFNRFVATKVARFSDLVDSIDSVTQQVRMAGPQDLNTVYLPKGKLEFKEAQQLNSSIVELITEINSSKQRHLEDLIETEKNKTLSSMARQVAHDIRSPLEVLKALGPEMRPLSEESRGTLRLVINRIEEIAYKLLANTKKGIIQNEETRTEELIDLVSGILTEKRIEYRHHSQTQISDSLGPDTSGLFSCVRHVSLKSILSNLINNGVEALQGNAGAVHVALYEENGANVITVTDSGTGIPDHARDKVFSEGFTTKETGNGIGLFSARQEIESWGGELSFTSKTGLGTTFTVRLPAVRPPDYFASAVDLSSFNKVIVLDDDPAFHDVWLRRFEGEELILERFYSVKPILEKYSSLDKDVLLLTDFDLLEQGSDGIDVILKLNHVVHSILVTARFDDESVQQRCREAGIRLLPKSLVTRTPLFSKKKEAVVLIDDDRLTHINWSGFCKKSNIPFSGYFSINDFLQDEKLIKRSLQIYIDSDLGDGIRGEIESERLFRAGFKNLYLVTGYEKDSIIRPPWIKEVFSKSEGIPHVLRSET